MLLLISLLAFRYYFPNSGHVMFSLEFAYCLFISFCTLVHVDSATFSGATSHGLQWENKTYKLKRSIVGSSTHYQGYRKSQLELSLETLRSRFGHFAANLTTNCGLSLTVSRYLYPSASISGDSGVEAQGCHVCVHSFTSILAEIFSSK